MCTLQATAQQLSVRLGFRWRRSRSGRTRPLADLLIGHPSSGDASAMAFGLMAAVVLVVTAAALRLHPDAGSAVSLRRSTESPRTA